MSVSLVVSRPGRSRYGAEVSTASLRSSGKYSWLVKVAWATWTMTWMCTVRPGCAGWPQAAPGLPGPFAPAPLQNLHHYYGPVRPCASHHYLVAHSVRRSRFSLSRPGGNLRPLQLASLSRRQVLLFHVSAHDELTPPLHRAPPGQHAGRTLAERAQPTTRVCPGSSPIPRCWCRLRAFRCVTSGSLTFVFSSHT